MTARTVRLDPASARVFFDRLSLEFLSAPARLAIAGRPVVSLLNITDFVAEYSLDGFRFLMRLLRHRVRSLLGIDPFLLGLIPNGHPSGVALCNHLPCDGVTGYGLLPNWAGPAVQAYADLIEYRTAEWYRIQRQLRVPFFPVVCAGWDATRRGEHIDDIRRAEGFPWRPVVVDASPTLFGDFLDRADEYLEATEAEHRIIFIHAWNEWSEGSAVEPGLRNRNGYLDELRRRFGSDLTLAGFPDPKGGEL
jgi:hypothetical protein